MERFLFIFFAITLFLIFLTPMELGDIWWHLKTGEWIWQNKSLPQKDPFSIVEAKGSPVLTANWLSQLIFYGVYSLGGIYGLIVLKSILFTVSFLLLNSLLKGYGIKAPLRYVLLIPSVFIATSYDEIRPQTLSFLFFTTLLYILEGNRVGKTKPFLFLPLIILLWANMHPGFIAGISLIVIYALIDLIKAKRFGIHFLIFASAILISILNPNGLMSITSTGAMLTGSIKGTQSIHEHLPLREFVAFVGGKGLYIANIFLLILGISSFIIRALSKGRDCPAPTIDLLHLFLFLTFGLSSLITFRAGMFFGLIAIMVIGKNLTGLDIEKIFSQRTPQKILQFLGGIKRYLLTFLIAISLMLFLLPRTVIKKPAINEDLIPVKITNFIKSSALLGNIYHPYEWGGYLIWRLYPDYKVFIDGRAIGPLQEYNDVLSGRKTWKEILTKYKVSTVIYWPLLPYKGNVPSLIFCLLKDDAWSPMYWDLSSIAFVRTELAKNPINKDSIWELLTSLISANIAKSPSEAKNYISLGEVYMEKGMRDPAISSFEKALLLEPNNKKALLYLKAMGAE